MNRNGQLVFVGLMVAALVFIMVVSLLEPLKDQAASARVSLDCDNVSLSPGEAGTCIVTDSYLFAWVGVALAVGLGFVGFRRLGRVGGV